MLVLHQRAAAQAPDITHFRDGVLTWTDTATSGFHRVEWAPSLTGTWRNTWNPLVDIPAVPGTTSREVPLFYRVIQGDARILPEPPTDRPPDVSGFSATGGDGFVGLAWTLPTHQGLAGVRVVRSTTWYPSTPEQGQTVFTGIAGSFLDTGVLNDTRYYYSAFTWDAPGNYSYGNIAAALPADITPPPPVSSFLAVAGDHQAVLSWQNPAGAGFAGVKVVRTTDAPPAGPSSGTTVYSGSGTNAVDLNLTNLKAYYYKAFSFDSVPNYSAGVPATCTPLNLLPPGDVQNVTATPADTRVTLGWRNPTGGDFLGVRIQRNVGAPPSGAFDGTTVYSGNAQTFADLNVTNETTYFYQFFSFDEVPNYSTGVDTNATPVDVTAPGNVTTLTAAPSNAMIVLYWTNPTDVDFTGVRIQRGTETYPTGPADGTTVFAGLGTTFTDCTLSNGTTYRYKVFAHDEVPNYATGVSVSAVPSRVAWTESFEATTGWQDYTNMQVWTHMAPSGTWWGNLVDAVTFAPYVRSGTRCLVGRGGLSLTLPDLNPKEFRFWARLPAAGSQLLWVRPSYFDGYAWYDLPTTEKRVSSVAFTEFIVGLSLPGSYVSKLEVDFSGSIIIDDVQLRVAP